MASYEITTKNGVYVGWFGIVRVVEEDDARQETRLTVEHKYFNGLTGERMQTVSFNGAGDFQVAMRGVGHQIDLYALVKVYGEVWSDEPDHAPRVEAEYVRLWPWGTFSFAAAYGTQRGSDAWRKLNTVALEEIYDAKPTRRYYQERLGLRPQDKVREELRQRRREFLRLGQEIADSQPAEQRANVERLPRALLATDELAIDEVIWASITAESDRAIARILGLAIELGNDRVRDEAISNLYEYDLVLGEVLPALIRTLLDNDIPTQSWAFRLLQRFGPDAAPAVPTLLAALKKDDSATRSGACGVLASIGPGAAPALAALMRATDDEDRGVRESAVYALAALGPLAGVALPRLKEILEGDDHATVRGSAARAIAAVDARRTESVAILIEALMDDESFVREAAAAALGNLGRAAASAAKALAKTLEDDSLGVRVAAAESLCRISNKMAASVSTLVHVLEVGDTGGKTSALYALGAMDAKAQGAVPALVAVLDDDNEWFAAHGDSTHELAIDALGSVGIAAAPAVPHLIRKLEEEDARIRARAAVALWRIKRYEKFAHTAG